MPHEELYHPLVEVGPGRLAGEAVLLAGLDQQLVRLPMPGQGLQELESVLEVDVVVVRAVDEQEGARSSPAASSGEAAR
jgi:hypothetical protein